MNMYTMKDVCEKTGLSAHTLRYYEKEGLLPDIARSEGGVRRYSENDLELLGLICCLKNTGMPLKEIARFIELTQQGEHTLKERCEILKSHKQQVEVRMEELKTYFEKVTWKLNFFSEKLRAYEQRGEKEG